MKNFTCLFLFLYLISFNSFAQFSGSYDPSNWTTTLTPGSSGSMDISGAPASILMTGSDGANASNMDIDYTITTVATGIWSFNWAYHTNDTDMDPQYDPAGVLIDGVFTQLTDDVGGVDQSGTYTSVSIPAGTVIGFRVRATDNIFGDATFTISSFSAPGGTLPVKLIGFTARKDGSSVLLNWQTATEENASHFEIERSADGLLYHEFARLSTGAPSHQYTIKDNSPLKGVNYYRLRMVDLDNHFDYSPVLIVRFGADVFRDLYPNPAIDFITVEIESQTGGHSLLNVFDASGRLIRAESVLLSPGINKVQVNISTFDKGLYLIRSGENGRVQSFIKK